MEKMRCSLSIMLRHYLECQNRQICAFIRQKRLLKNVCEIGLSHVMIMKESCTGCAALNGNQIINQEDEEKWNLK